MTLAESVQNMSIVIGSAVIINTVVQAIWNNYTVKKIALCVSLGGALTGVATTAMGVFGLIFPFAYDYNTFHAPGGLTNQFSRVAITGILLANISAIAFVII